MDNPMLPRPCMPYHRTNRMDNHLDSLRTIGRAALTRVGLRTRRRLRIGVDRSNLLRYQTAVYQGPQLHHIQAVGRRRGVQLASLHLVISMYSGRVRPMPTGMSVVRVPLSAHLDLCRTTMTAASNLSRRLSVRAPRLVCTKIELPLLDIHRPDSPAKVTAAQQPSMTKGGLRRRKRSEGSRLRSKITYPPIWLTNARHHLSSAAPIHRAGRLLSRALRRKLQGRTGLSRMPQTDAPSARHLRPSRIQRRHRAM